jgi:hypothetical protein
MSRQTPYEPIVPGLTTSLDRSEFGLHAHLDIHPLYLGVVPLGADQDHDLHEAGVVTTVP